MRRTLLLSSIAFFLIGCQDRSGVVEHPYGIYKSDSPYNYHVDSYQLTLNVEGYYELCSRSICETGEIQHVNKAVVGLMGFYDSDVGLKFDRDSDPTFADFRLRQRQESKVKRGYLYFSPHQCEDTICVWFGEKENPFVFKRVKKFEFTGIGKPIFYRNTEN